VVRKELVSNVELLRAVYKGFCGARNTVEGQYTQGMIFNNMATVMPWFSKLIDKDRRLMGDDWWPYRLEANRKAVETFLRYHFELGLSEHRLTCEDIFVPELLGA